MKEKIYWIEKKSALLRGGFWTITIFKSIGKRMAWSHLGTEMSSLTNKIVHLNFYLKVKYFSLLLQGEASPNAEKVKNTPHGLALYYGVQMSKAFNGRRIWNEHTISLSIHKIAAAFSNSPQ